MRPVGLFQYCRCSGNCLIKLLETLFTNVIVSFEQSYLFLDDILAAVFGITDHQYCEPDVYSVFVFYIIFALSCCVPRVLITLTGNRNSAKKNKNASVIQCQ